MLRTANWIGYNEGVALNQRANGFRARLGGPVSLRSAPTPDALELHLEDGAMRFEARPSSIPTVVVTHDDNGVAQVFVRYAHKDGEVIGFPTERARALIAEVRSAVESGNARRVVLVGADALFEPRREAFPGRLDAISTFAALVDGLADIRCPIVWRTRGGLVGTLPSDLGAALQKVGRLLTVEIGIPTMEPRVAATLEGNRSASPDDRLRLAAALSTRNIAIHAVLDPMVPMLTDQPEQIRKLFSALVDAGAHRVAVRYLVLTRSRARALSRRLSPMTRDLIKGIFADEPWRAADPLAPSSSMHEPHKLLPPSLRRLGHQRMKELGAVHGLLVDVLDPATESEVLSRDDRVRRREEGRDRLRGRRQSLRPVPQLDLFGLKAG